MTGSPPRSGRSRNWLPRNRAGVVIALVLAVSLPMMTGHHVLQSVSLPLILMIVACLVSAGTFASAFVLRLHTQATAHRRNTALMRRLAALCRQDDLPDQQERVFDLVSFLARKVGLTRRGQILLSTASTLHRIGLVSLPPSPAGDHPGTVRRAGAIAKRLLSGPTALNRVAIDMALWHAEQWDGGGLPAGLADTEIPFPVRLLQVALTLDALLPRTGCVPNRAALGVIAARLQGESGRTLDPALAGLAARHLAGLEALLRSRPIHTEPVGPHCTRSPGGGTRRVACSPRRWSQRLEDRLA